MSDFTFEPCHIQNLEMELSDTDIFNDVLCIAQDSGTDVMIRGYDPDSIRKYGRRSLRINRPLAVSVEVAQTLVEQALDKYHEPKLRAILTTNAIDELHEVVADILSLDIYISGENYRTTVVTLPIGDIGMGGEGQTMDFVVEAVENALGDIVPSMVLTLKEL